MKKNDLDFPANSNSKKIFNKNSKVNKLTFITAFILMSFFTFSANAATYVVTNTTDMNDGTCDADCSLREAIAAANGTADDDVINFASGVSGTITLSTSRLQINNNGTLTINGPTTSPGITVSGNNSVVVFFINNGATAELNYLTIADGSGTNGGGVFNVGALLTINNSTIRNNFGDGNGGGIFIGSDSILTVNNSTISTNSATSRGGGISNDGTANINNSTISNNTSVSPSGFFNAGGTLNLLNTVIGNNNSTAGSLGDCSNQFSGTVNATYSLIEGGNCLTNGVNNNIVADPLLGSLADNGGPTQTHALLTGSPAIDMADPNNFPSIDQRGNLRPADGGNPFSSTFLFGKQELILALAPDIGSYEALAPTAALVSISGRVLTSSNRGIRNALVQLTDGSGNVLIARTNQFGYYKFEDLEVGQTLVFNIKAKSYRFSPQIVNLVENLTNLDFIAEEVVGDSKKVKR